ncbi:MAG: cupin [Methanosphaera sp. rholeuAM270]|nr:MAG: cupin [Methanosphaera sp. rholeuAM270]
MSLNTSTIYPTDKIVEYQEKSVVSTEIIKKDTGTVTLFAFDEGEGLSEHTAPFDALVQVLEGKLKLTIDGEEFILNKADSIIMPANIPHALHAETKFKMILTMIKS